MRIFLYISLYGHSLRWVARGRVSNGFLRLSFPCYNEREFLRNKMDREVRITLTIEELRELIREEIRREITAPSQEKLTIDTFPVDDLGPWPDSMS